MRCTAFVTASSSCCSSPVQLLILSTDKPHPAGHHPGSTIGTADIQYAISQGATDIRVNQQQVNALGQRVGINRPDLQYTLPGNNRVYIEYDNTTPGTWPNTPRGNQHADRILANDPNGGVILRS